jgi:HSP20 family protein
LLRPAPAARVAKQENHIMLTLWNSFDRAFDNDLMQLDKLFSTRPATRSAGNAMAAVPPVNLHETEDAYELSADVPGFTPEQLNVTLEDGVLTLTGKLEEANEQKDEANRSLRRERRRMSFTRTFRFETPLDEDAVAAKIEHGVLTLRLPKAAAAKPKTIPVVAT